MLEMSNPTVTSRAHVHIKSITESMLKDLKPTGVQRFLRHVANSRAVFQSGNGP